MKCQHALVYSKINKAGRPAGASSEFCGGSRDDRTATKVLLPRPVRVSGGRGPRPPMQLHPSSTPTAGGARIQRRRSPHCDRPRWPGAGLKSGADTRRRFSIGAIDSDGQLIGAAIVGRPVARLAGPPRQVLEVVRLVTDGTPNACSMLYAATEPARAGAKSALQIIWQTIVKDHGPENRAGASLTTRRPP